MFSGDGAVQRRCLRRRERSRHRVEGGTGRSAAGLSRSAVARSWSQPGPGICNGGHRESHKSGDVSPPYYSRSSEDPAPVSVIRLLCSLRRRADRSGISFFRGGRPEAAQAEPPTAGTAPYARPRRGLRPNPQRGQEEAAAKRAPLLLRSTYIPTRRAVEPE